MSILFFKRAQELSETIRSWNRKGKIMVVGHRDGDGMSAASVLYQGLKKLGFKRIIPQIMLSPDTDILKSLLNEYKPKYVITGDIGSGFHPILSEAKVEFLIADHHPNKSGEYQEYQLNCIEFGLNDEVDASGSTTAFSLLLPLFEDVFWETNEGKVILAYAISGAISDFQFQKGITGVNKFVLDLARAVGAIKMQKDISFFGRGMYPAYVALNRASIPGFSDHFLCQDAVCSIIEPKVNGFWKRIIDLTVQEKQKLLDIIINRVSQFSSTINIKEFLSKEVIGFVFDLQALYGWHCTLLSDGRYTLDPREILHRINYCCRLGHWDIALDLLTKPFVSEHVLATISNLHAEGDQEVAHALRSYENGVLSMKSACNGKVVLIDLTDCVFYDEVGVVAGVIMKQDRNIEIILSSCRMDDNGQFKVSVRARESVWEMLDSDDEFADAKKVYARTKKETGAEIKYGGHRFAMSGYVPEMVVPKLFENMIIYYESLKYENKQGVKP